MKRFLAAAGAGLLFAACGTAQASVPTAGNATTASTGATHVTVTLGDNMRIALDKSSVPAGKVTFSVTNTGTMKHEVVVLKTDLAPDQIPAGKEAGMVSEDTSVGESGDMDPGTSKEFTLDLAAGKYLLICNEPGHFAAGMHTPFVVK